MKNPNFACEIFKILLTEHVSNAGGLEDCFTSKPDRYLDKYQIDSLITNSFRLSDQFLSRVDDDPEWKKAQAEARQKQQAAVRPTMPPPKPCPVPEKAEAKKP